MPRVEPKYTELNQVPVANPDLKQFTSSIQQNSWYRQQLKGWRFGILTGSLLSFTVLFINLAVIIAATTRKPTADQVPGRKTLFTGNCDHVKRLNSGIHVVINILSTLLLGASNYAMQFLSAPTRPEVDRAHARRLWLDIGAMSTHNLGRISRKRAVLWLILGVSSLPLHLVYVSRNQLISRSNNQL
jgi:hypothetical protein